MSHLRNVFFGDCDMGLMGDDDPPLPDVFKNFATGGAVGLETQASTPPSAIAAFTTEAAKATMVNAQSDTPGIVTAAAVGAVAVGALALLKGGRRRRRRR